MTGRPTIPLGTRAEFLECLADQMWGARRRPRAAPDPGDRGWRPDRPHPPFQDPQRDGDRGWRQRRRALLAMTPTGYAVLLAEAACDPDGAPLSGLPADQRRRLLGASPYGGAILAAEARARRGV